MIVHACQELAAIRCKQRDDLCDVFCCADPAERNEFEPLIARKADVGLGTLYRHFPTREALLEALLRTTLDDLTKMAGELEASKSSDDALLCFFREGVGFVRSYSGMVNTMAAAIADENSALHTSCTTLRTAGARLLRNAQRAGFARADIDGADLFALMAALGWLGDQASFARRAEHLADLIAGAILTRSRGGCDKG